MALEQFGKWARKYLDITPKEKFIALEDGEIINYLDENYQEHPDDTQIAPPVGFNPQPSLAETIRNMVRSERLRQELEGQDMETFEEADDFDVGDDYDPTTPYENDFDPDYREVKDVVERSRLSATQEPDQADQDADSGPAKKNRVGSADTVTEPAKPAKSGA